MKKLWILPCLLALSACHRRNAGGGHGVAVPSGAAITLTNDEERTLYTLGSLLGQRISEFRLTPREIAIVQRGMTDQLTHVPHMLADSATFGPRVAALAQARQASGAQETRRAGVAYLARAAAESGTERLPSGVLYHELAAGTGPQPAATDEVTVHYTGTLIDGTEFDSSRRRNEPATFPLRGVIPCWTEGVQRMHQGGRARLVCPAEAAYGDRAQRQIPAGSTLIFDVELLRVTPHAPPDAGAPSGDGGPTVITAAPGAAPTARTITLPAMH